MEKAPETRVHPQTGGWGEEGPTPKQPGATFTVTDILHLDCGNGHTAEYV